VVTTWFPTPAAPATGAFVAKDVTALAERDDVEVLHLVAPRLADAPQHADHDGARVERVRFDVRDPRAHARARALVAERAEGRDVLHTMAFSSLLPYLRGPRPALPWVHTEHWQGATRPDVLPPHLRLVRNVLVGVLRRPDVVTAVSREAVRGIRAIRGEESSLLVPCIVRSGSPVRPRRPRPGTTAEGAPLRLVAVGGLVPLKDPLLLVGALAELRARGVAASLVWVGDGPLRAEVEARAAELGVSDALRITGQVEPADVYAEVEGADIFVLPSVNETFGVAIAEAVAHGRPVVVSARGAQREYLSGTVATFVEERTPAAWADGILEADEDTAGTPAAAIAATLGRAFTPERVVAGYRTAYAAAAAARGARG